VLLLGFSRLNCHLPPQDGFFFFAEPLDLLLDPEQLLLIDSFVFGGHFLPVLQLFLFEFSISLDDLYW
jgi:hypothetical protein